MRSWWSILALGLALVPLSTARADGPPKAAADTADASGGADEVILKNGGMLRGTIVQMEPQKQVVILIQGTGEQRTVRWAEVESVERGKYPAAAPPPEKKPKKASPPPSASDDDADDDDAAPKKKKRKHARHDEDDEDDEEADTPGKSKVSFASEQPDLTFHVLTGEMNGIVSAGQYWGAMHAESYRELCTAPCSVKLKNGPYKLGLSIEGRTPIKAEESFFVRGPKTVTGTYESNRGIRIGGILVLTLGVLAGSAMIIGSPFAGGQTCEPSGIPGVPPLCTHRVSIPLLIGGTAVALGSAVAGMIMLFQRDHAHISVSPGASALLSPRALPKDALSVDQLKGLTVRAVF